jgi:hypothetical protein
MIKYFYTNRSLPKRKLTEAEMLEINSLYRIIGRCEADIARLQSPRSSEKGGLPPILAQAYERFGAIPRSTRALYCGSAVGLLVLVMLILRRWRNRDADY